MKDSIFVKYVSTLVVQELDGGMFKATSTHTHSKSDDGLEWDSKTIESNAISDDRDKAIQDVVLTISTYLDAIGGDLFTQDALPPERLN